MQKVISQILTLTVLTGLAAAQAKPAPKAPVPSAPASQTVQKPAAVAKPSPVATKAAPVAAKAAPVAAKAVPVAAKPAAKPPVKSSPAKTGAAKPMPAKPAVKPAEKPVAEKTAATPAPKPVATSNRAKRDPFVSPVRQQSAGGGSPACVSGPRCLVIAQVVLKGVVKTQNGMIAMVESAAKKQYNLHEKDTVQSGFVLRITSDSIVFRETVTDMLGNSSSREVVKRVTVPAV